MATIVPATVDEHVAVVKATAPKYFKGASDLTFRFRLWLKMLENSGRVTYNATSHSCVWNLEVHQPDVKQYGDAGELEFNEHDALEQLTVDVRGYYATDRLTTKQNLMNRGKEQIDDLYKNKSKRLAKRMRQVLCRELYIDGNAAGNTQRLCGIETALNDDGATVAADKVARPSDTYAGKGTAPQTFGGNWSTDLTTSPNATIATDWPEGNGDADYDATTPLLVNTSSTSWGTGSTSWIDNCEIAMRYARIMQTSRGAIDEDPRTPFMFMLSPTLYNDFLNFYSSRNRQITPHKAAEDLGFGGNTMNFEGAMVHHEFDAPAGIGYAIVPTQIELFLLQSQLMKSYGPEFAIEKMSYLYLIYTFGNLRLASKFLTKFKAYA